MAKKNPIERKRTKKRAGLSTAGNQANRNDEELQSASEELETSKEELQLLNQDLVSVNKQLARKVEELEAAVRAVGTVQDGTVQDGTVQDGTVQDMAQEKPSERNLRESEQRFRAMTDDLPLMVWLHDAEGRQIFVNKTLCEYFGLPRGQMKGDRWRDLVDPEDRSYAEEFIACVRDRRPFHAQVRARRADGQWRWIESWGRPRFGPDREYLGHIGGSADITQRKIAEFERDNLNATLERQVEQRTQSLKLLQEITRIGNESRNVEEAMQASLERIAQYSGWQVGHAWRLAEDGSGDMVSSGIWHVGENYKKAIGRLQEFQEICANARFAPGDILVGAIASSKEAQWIDDITQASNWQRGDAIELGLHAVIGFPVTHSGKLVAVLEFFSDRPTSRETRFMEIMPDVGIQLGHVIERKRLEKLVADAAELEQRRIGGDIHDGVGQELTGLRYVAHTHMESLAELSSPEVKTAERITQWLEKLQQQLRHVVRELVPVEIDALGLVAALRALAEQTSQTHELDCSFQCSQTIRVANTALATHLYRIAQEAVRNAVRHADASHIQITLTEDESLLTLQVDDDGVGIKQSLDQATGLGLHSMAYRADLIGANFDCRPKEGGGTRVTCTVSPGG